MAYTKQNFYKGQTLTHDHLNNIEDGICSIVTNEQFSDFATKSKDFLLKSGTNDKGESKLFALLSTTKNARCAAISLKDGHTYKIHAKNNSTSSTTWRMRIGVFAEDYSTLKFVPAAQDSCQGISASVGSPAAEILINTGAEGKNFYDATYVNSNNYKTLIIFMGWGNDYTDLEVSVTDEDIDYLNSNIKISSQNIDESSRQEMAKPWEAGDTHSITKQDKINLTNILTANMCKHNKATQAIMECAYDFWLRRDEFMYCNGTARDDAWDYWSTNGYYDVNTGKKVEAEAAGWKRIDCSTFAYYVTSGLGYYSSPYYNALEWTDVVQGALTNGIETSSADATVCRTGAMQVRAGKSLILESVNSSKYYFTGIYGYTENGTLVQTFDNISIGTVLKPNDDVRYIRAEMKVVSASNYAPKVTTVPRAPAAILKLLRIRENEQLPVHALCPNDQRYAKAMCKWYDDNGYGMNYNRWLYKDSDFPVGSIMWWGRTTSPNNYKYITHITVYIGSGYLIHSAPALGLVGGEGIHIQPLSELFDDYTQPLVAVASPEYHTDYSEEKRLLGIS